MPSQTRFPDRPAVGYNKSKCVRSVLLLHEVSTIIQYVPLKQLEIVRRQMLRDKRLQIHDGDT